MKRTLPSPCSFASFDVSLVGPSEAPSLAPSVGLVAFGAESYEHKMCDLNDESKVLRMNGWPERINYPERWCHSDIKDVAYFYVYRFFDKVIEKGSLK